MIRKDFWVASGTEFYRHTVDVAGKEVYAVHMLPTYIPAAERPTLVQIEDALRHKLMAEIEKQLYKGTR